MDHFNSQYNESELVIGLIGTVGTDLAKVEEAIKKRLEHTGYEVISIRVSSDIIPFIVDVSEAVTEAERISLLMDAGDEARKVSGDNSILATAAAALIGQKRGKDAEGHPQQRGKTAYIINSLKHPDEVHRLRQIYPLGFYVISVHCDHQLRLERLTEEMKVTEDSALAFMKREEEEKEGEEYGQSPVAAFHLADFFIRVGDSERELKRTIWRIVEILFGDPYKTPTFDEYAMFLAFASALRSADLSRQVGAVLARNNEILASGANDCPKYGGGLYWPVFDFSKGDYADTPHGRDYTRGFDSNKAEQAEIINRLTEKLTAQGMDETIVRETLESSQIRDLTEYGRVVHAEMEALLCCSRNSISARGSTLYCTTFPCHNCAKHIIAAGVERVVYIEPYPKSKAGKFHGDSISMGFTDDQEHVHFEPFVGVGPRRFFDLFSMGLGSGYPLKRKAKDGSILDSKLKDSSLRIQMRPGSYLDMESAAASHYAGLLEKLKKGSGENETGV
ncbi:MAG: anti-phage dCTP deaminase [Lentisphaeria bacterium]|nr:anti-phage dCTP deaminase [Lentisphaeria bacterium]